MIDSLHAIRDEALRRLSELGPGVTEAELREDVNVLNVVNFGGGSYVLYAEIHDDGTIEVDPEPYADNFDRPARLLPVEAKALVAAIDLIGDHLPEGALTSAREKIVDALGADPLEQRWIAHAGLDQQAIRPITEEPPGPAQPHAVGARERGQGDVVPVAGEQQGGQDVARPVGHGDDVGAGGVRSQAGVGPERHPEGLVMLLALGLLLKQAYHDHALLKELIEAGEPEWFD